MDSDEKGLARQPLDGFVGFISLVAFLGALSVFGAFVVGEIKQSAEEHGAASATEQAIDDAWNSSREAGDWDESLTDDYALDGKSAWIEAELEEYRWEGLSESMFPDPQPRSQHAWDSTSSAPPAGNGCDSSYPTLCLPSFPDLDCDDIAPRRFPVYPPDPHGFDGDSDGVGCEV